MRQIVEAIIEQLTVLPGSEVTLKLEIDARVGPRTAGCVSEVSVNALRPSSVSLVGTADTEPISAAPIKLHARSSPVS
jgi:hypothetical protein